MRPRGVGADAGRSCGGFGFERVCLVPSLRLGAREASQDSPHGAFPQARTLSVTGSIHDGSINIAVRAHFGLVIPSGDISMEVTADMVLEGKGRELVKRMKVCFAVHCAL